MKQLSIGLFQLYSELQPPDAEPLSIMSLAAALQEKYGTLLSVDLYRVDNRLEDRNIFSLSHIIEEKNYVIIGISIPQGTLEISKELIALIKRRSSFSKILLGNAIPSYAASETLSMFPEAVIIAGWGEGPLLAFIDHIINNEPIQEIPGVITYENQANHSLAQCWLPAKWPLPNRIFTDVYPRVEASRGCHYNACKYCTRPIIGKSMPVWKRIAPFEVIQMIDDVKSQGFTSFTFTDEDFIGNNIESATEIALGLSRMGKMDFTMSLRADNTFGIDDNTARYKKLFDLLKTAGLSMVFIGIESVNDSQLKRYNKGISGQDNIKVIQAMNSFGVELEAGFMLFDPQLSMLELRESLDIIGKSNIWKSIGRIINKLRIQKGSRYEKIFQSLEQELHFDLNTLSYDWNFQDDELRMVYQSAWEWRTWLEETHLNLRNASRQGNNLKQERILVQEFRWLAFSYLKALVFQHNSDLMDIIKRSYQWLDKIHRSIDELNELTPANKILLHGVLASKSSKFKP